LTDLATNALRASTVEAALTRLSDVIMAVITMNNIFIMLSVEFSNYLIFISLSRLMHPDLHQVICDSTEECFPMTVVHYASAFLASFRMKC